MPDDELLLIYRDFEEGKGERSGLARSLYWRIKQQNGGVLPKAVGSRPRKAHEELLIAVMIAEALAAQGRTGMRRNVTKACEETVLVRDNWSLPPDKMPDELLLIYRDFEEGKRELSPLAFSHYRKIKQQNGGAKACEEICRLPSLRHLRDIYYKYTSDPDRRRILELALAERAWPWTEPEPTAEPTMVRDIPPEFYEAGLARSQTTLSKEDYQRWEQEVRDRQELRDRRDQAPRVVSRPRRFRYRFRPAGTPPTEEELKLRGSGRAVLASS